MEVASHVSQPLRGDTTIGPCASRSITPAALRWRRHPMSRKPRCRSRSARSRRQLNGQFGYKLSYKREDCMRRCFIPKNAPSTAIKRCEAPSYLPAIKERAMSEDNLLRSIARGDRHAFVELHRVDYRRLVRYLATRIPTSRSADEIIATPSWLYGAVPVSFDGNGSSTDRGIGKLHRDYCDRRRIDFHGNRGWDRGRSAAAIGPSASRASATNSTAMLKAPMTP